MTSYEEPAERVRAIVDAHTDSGPYTPRTAAAEIVEKMRANEPELLAAWLDEMAVHFVWQLINDRDRSRRGRSVFRDRSAAFRAAQAAHESGDPEALRAWLDAPFTVEDGTRRKLATLRRDDLAFVAGGYTERVRENGMRAAFFTALSKKVGAGTVADHFTESQLDEMWRSLST